LILAQILCFDEENGGPERDFVNAPAWLSKYAKHDH